MVVKVKVQKDHYLTEVSVEVPADVSQVDELLKATKTTGKMIVLYNRGGVQAINIEQKTMINTKDGDQIKKILGIEEKLL